MKTIFRALILCFFLCPVLAQGQSHGEFLTRAPLEGGTQQLRLKTNILPWVTVVPNLGVEFTFAQKWSAAVEIWYSPWKIADKYSLKTAAILPEGRFWFKNCNKGSFINLHGNIAWYNVRFNNYRYQDKGTPLLGGGIGYGYRVEIGRYWGFEFEIGAGMAHGKYDRYYNVPNGSLKDTQSFTYWGLDRLCLTFSYNLCDI